MKLVHTIRWVSIFLTVFGAPMVFAQQGEKPTLPVKAEIFVDEPLTASEGIAFNGEGRLFVSANKGLWEIKPDATAVKLFDMDSNLGLAAYGERDILVADFGPTNAFRHDRNADGVVWHSTPEGEVSLFSTAVSHPNGMLISDDGLTLYVARIFHSIRPVVFDNSVWAIRLNEDGTPHRSEPRLVFRTDPGGGNDGLAMDTRGRLYVSTPLTGKIWRYDPDLEETIMVAEGMPGVAGLTFGRGKFDHHSIYATTTYSGGRGGKIYRIPVGIGGRN